MTNLKKSAGILASAGRHGDTMLAHINPQEAAMLKAAGGSGTINPDTGLPEYFKFFGVDVSFTGIRDAFESVAVAVGNYFLPGSSIVTSQLVSKGSQKQLNSTVGRLAQIGSGVSGGLSGNLSCYGNLGQMFSNGIDAISNGMGDVSSWISKTVDSFSGSESVGSAVGNAKDAVGTAAGNMTGNVADSAAKTFAESSSIASNGTPAEWAAGKSGLPPLSQGMGNAPGVAPAAGANAAPQGLLSRTADAAVKFIEKNPTTALMAGQTATATIGGIGTAQANAEAARLNRETQMAMPAIQRQANMVQGAFAGPTPFTAADPNEVLTTDGKYIRGPKAGQYAPGRGPGILASAGR